MSLLGRIGDWFSGHIIEPIQETVAGINTRASETFGRIGDWISDRLPSNRRDSGETDEDEEIIEAQEIAAQDTSEQAPSMPDDTDSVEIDGLIWEFRASDFAEIGPGDGSIYIVADYEILMKDGEIVTGQIKYYGPEDKLIRAIIAKHGEIDSGDIVNVSYEILEEDEA